MSKMTKDDMIQAYAMRLNGIKLQEIADKFGVTASYIHKITRGVGQRRVRGNVFPNIQKYIEDHNLYLYQFCDLIEASQTAVINWFKGSTEPSLHYVRKILAVTGMDFHTAFAIEGSEDGKG